MTDLILGLGLVVAAAAAARSTWSPCGLSMLSSITPFGERARGHRYGVTATWFVVGATVGGATLGAVAAGLAAVARLFALGAHPGVAAVAVATAASMAVAIDTGAFGARLPFVRRQVDDAWLSRYRSWVYGAGFGWQIGVGVTTYVMTAAVFLVAVLGVTSADPVVAVLLGTSFGWCRGLAVLLTCRASSPVRLRALHRGLERSREPIRWAVIVLEVAVAAIVVGVEWPVAGAGVAAAGLVAVAAPPAWSLTRRRLRRAPLRMAADGGT